MQQILNRRTRKFESKTVQSNSFNAESDDSEEKSPHWTTEPNDYAFSMMVSEDESAGARSKSASVKVESDEEMEIKLSTMDDY